jgi:transcriptional regulator with XRE-family HTH domain
MGEVIMLGDMIAELRKDRNLLQKDLARLLNVTIGTISNYETNVHAPDIESLIKLADFFDISTDYMLERIKFKPSLKQLNTAIIDHEGGETSLGEVLNMISKLTPKSQQALTAHIELLQLKDKQKNSQNSP